uniref:Uncharacterized protein n=1 Tax=Candidatus Kentrum sp. LPFa TaxID=2126335 RepID=A0A450W3Z9_9GAMM|nr:MAG: hypothetical protein BECKLPF1236B_GA0070989_10247 [Candidatus Kentron sp. LPFa]
MNRLTLNAHKTLLILLQIISTSLFIVWAIYFSLGQALDIPLFHLDGAYQTASSLFRLSEGQFPGRDFQPYLGIGVTYLLFPAYWFAGNTIAASQFSAFLVTTLVGTFVIAVVWQLVFQLRNFITAILVGGLIYSLTVVFIKAFGFHLPQEIAYAFEPGNSLRLVRAFAPYFAVTFFYNLLTSIADIRLRISLYAMLTGLLLLWSNDFAIPTAGMFGVLILHHAIHGGYFTWQRALAYSFFTAVFWLLLLAIGTAGHGFSFFTYNFIDVVKDQWWYFGPYEAKARIFGLTDLYKIFDSKVTYASLLLIAIIFRAVWLRQLEALLLAWLGCVLFLGGLLPSVGGHVGGYHSAFVFWAVITTILLLLNGVWIFAMRRVSSGSPRGRMIVMFAIVIQLACVAKWQHVHYKDLKQANQADLSLMYVESLGGYLPREFSDYVDFSLMQGNLDIVEEYWGIFSAINRSFPDWQVDSVIHSLGRMRDQATQTVDDADLVITTRYRLSRDWQPWNLSQNYWFYDELFKKWEVVGYSPTTVIWSKTDNHREFDPIPCTVDAVAKTIRLNVLRSGFYRVVLDYELSTKKRRLLMFQNNISFAPDAKGYISVDPAGSSVIYPVYISSLNSSELNTKVVGGTQEELLLHRCEASSIPNISSEVLHVPGTIVNDFFWYYQSDVYLVRGQDAPVQFFGTDDSSWINGIGRNHAGFFLPNTREVNQGFVKGRIVKMQDGTMRRITDIVKGGNYYSVFLDGQPLDAKSVGLPSTFTLVTE